MGGGVGGAGGVRRAGSVVPGVCSSSPPSWKDESVNELVDDCVRRSVSPDEKRSGFNATM